jgi:hypothetical protein
VNHPEEDCWLFTLMTTRALKIVYFDGSSAVKLPGGTLDTQDLLLCGEPRGGEDEEELQRIRYICEWGKDLNTAPNFRRCCILNSSQDADGLVSIRVSFSASKRFTSRWISEVMLCNVTSGVRVVSSSNVVFPLHRWPEEPLFCELDHRTREILLT